MMSARTFVIFLMLPAALGGVFQEHIYCVWISGSREGRLLFVATPVGKGETISDREKVRTTDGIFRRLHVGDQVQKGQILGQVDTQLADQDLKIAKAKLKLAEAELTVAQRSCDVAVRRFNVQKQLRETSLEDLKASETMWKRSVAEVKSKKAAIEVVQLEIELCRLVLSSYTIRSPENGKIKTISKQGGDWVSPYGEPIIEIETKGPG